MSSVAEPNPLVARTFMPRKYSDFRRAREQTSILIRKEKREETLAKRRFKFSEGQEGKDNLNLLSGEEYEFGMHGGVQSTSNMGGHDCDGNSGSGGQLLHADTTISSPAPGLAISPSSSSSSDIRTLMDGMMSADFNIQLNSLHFLRRQLCGENNSEPPFKECIRVGAVGKFVEFLKSNRQELHYEAAWALTNIASSVHTHTVVQAHAIQPLIALLESSKEDVREQCAWCLANIAGENVQYRDAVIKYGGIEKLVRAIPADTCKKSYLENTIWSLSNMCRGKPQPPIERIMPAVYVFSKIVQNCEFSDIVNDAVWALEYITNSTDRNIDVIVNLEGGVLLHRLVQLLRSTNQKYTLPLLKVLGNMASGTDDHVDKLLQLNFLDAIIPYLSHSKPQTRKEACWILSNIAAGTNSQARLFVANNGIVSGVLNQMNRSNAFEVRREARFIITNLVNKKRVDIIRPFIQGGVLELLFDNVCEVDNVFVFESLKCLEKIFETIPNQLDLVRDRIDSVSGVDRLEALQEHQDDKIYNTALVMLQKYFGFEEIDQSGQHQQPLEAVSIAPKQSDAVFQFGINMQQQEQNQHTQPAAAAALSSMKGGQYVQRHAGTHVDPNAYHGSRQQAVANGAQGSFSFEL